MIDRPEFTDKQQVEAPFLHYLSIYEASDPAEIASRTGLPFENGNFALTLVGTVYDISHPDFLVVDRVTGNILRNPYEEILLIHFLTEGVFTPMTGEMIDYRGFSGGNLYHSKFKQRALDRLAREFGSNIDIIKNIADDAPGLIEKLSDGCDAGLCIEFIEGLRVKLMVWEKDDEFPASSQILFSDNFPKAFTAEDTAGVCDILISRLKKILLAEKKEKA